MTARMSISLRKEQGFNIMQRMSSKTPTLAQKGLNVHSKVTRDGKNVDFT